LNPTGVLLDVGSISHVSVLKSALEATSLYAHGVIMNFASGDPCRCITSNPSEQDAAVGCSERVQGCSCAYHLSTCCLSLHQLLLAAVYQPSNCA